MAEEVEDWGTNNQVRKNSLLIRPQEFTKVTKLTNISDALTKFLVTRALWCELHTCKHAQMDVENIPCYLIFLSSSLFNTPTYPSLVNSLHSFDIFSACDDFTALLLF